MRSTSGRGRLSGRSSTSPGDRRTGVGHRFMFAFSVTTSRLSAYIMPLMFDAPSRLYISGLVERDDVGRQRRARRSARRQRSSRTSPGRRLTHGCTTGDRDGRPWPRVSRLSKLLMDFLRNAAPALLRRHGSRALHSGRARQNPSVSASRVPLSPPGSHPPWRCRMQSPRHSRSFPGACWIRSTGRRLADRRSCERLAQPVGLA